jgi:hypothetical protein
MEARLALLVLAVLAIGVSGQAPALTFLGLGDWGGMGRLAFRFTKAGRPRKGAGYS